jgi:UDP-N-acetylglucosamine--N-acetylmuramyl-(pentapeptide) pyrophosphoryl-undecaprenol N-acetylglucosamine transferase
VSAPFVLAAGGTGGHMFPAEAVARELVARGRRVFLVTDARAESFGDRLPDVEIYRIQAGTPFGGPLGAAQGLGQLALGAAQARRLLRRLKPAAVAGFGGYPSVPTMLAARLLGRPTLIHEQNAVLGRANRLLAPRALRIATGFAETAKLRRADSTRAIHTGNPVRPTILAAACAYRAPSPGRTVELLVLGGSQGARALSEIVPTALALLPQSLRSVLRVSHQARAEDLDTAAAAYASAGIVVELQRFFTDVPQRMSRAHLAICRAGASTVAELAAIGRPAVLVPYPYATDDHQSANARAFAAAGAGWSMAQAELRPETLAERISGLLGDPGRLRQAAANAAGFARPEAAHDLARLVLALDRTAASERCAA